MRHHCEANIFSAPVGPLFQLYHLVQQHASAHTSFGSALDAGIQNELLFGACSLFPLIAILTHQDSILRLSIELQDPVVSVIRLQRQFSVGR